MLRCLLLRVLLLPMSSVQAAEERWIGTVLGKVAVDSSGRVTQATWHRNTLGEAIEATLLDRVRRVEFVPATLNGEAARSEASIAIRLGFVDASKAHINVVIEDIYVAPAFVNSGHRCTRGVNLCRARAASGE